MSDLPFIDEHAIEVDAPPARMWEALTEVAPHTGFRVVRAEAPEQLMLAGEHPFSRYELNFRIDELEGGRSRLRAETRAVFPGPRGAVYRALVIGTRMHVLMVRRMLRGIARRAR